jgi:hypothetical protein
MTIRAGTTTIKRLLDECFIITETDDEELSFAKVFGYTEEEFEKLDSHMVRELCGCPGWADSTTFRKPELDKDRMTAFNILFLTAWFPPTGVAKEIAAKYQCAVEITYREPLENLHGKFACHYESEDEGVVVDCNT